MKEATGEFTLTGWDEQTYADRSAGKLTRAEVTQDFSGGIEGTGSVQWLMCYREDGTADFVGMQDIEGTIDGRRGGFVVSTVGTFDGQRAEGNWSVITGSGRGDLAKIVGSGKFGARHGSQASYQLSYEIE